MKRLSIIIPAYNAEPYLGELLDCLEPQMTDDIECIVVDDGSREPVKTDHKWVTLLRKENGGCSTARNMGLDHAQGEYIQFIDADDMVPDYFISKLLKKIDQEHPDVIDYSWKSLTKEGSQHNNVLNSDTDYLTNPSVWSRCFKRSFIGDTRFNIKKDTTEDEDFSRKLGYLEPDSRIKHTVITDYMYFYRTAVPMSKVKRFKAGLMNTKRITYYYPYVTQEMTWLLDEIREEDETNEVWLLTNRCDIPELKRYARISKPIRLWTHKLRGEPYNDAIIIEPPIETQIVMYSSAINLIGGISTALYNWCYNMRQYYDILVVYDTIDPAQLVKFSKIVPIMRRTDKLNIRCDTLILNRLKDWVGPEIVYRRSIQMCHACYTKGYQLHEGMDIVHVSEASKTSWKSSGHVINNMAHATKEPIKLVSGTRVSPDKGKNVERMRKLAQLLKQQGIDFIWLNFSNKPIENMPAGFINMDPRLDIQPFIRASDYLVQLSDREAYSMVILEALTNNTAVLATPFDSLFEQGFEDGVTGYIVPFDVDFDVNQIKVVPKFNYDYDNNKRISQWRTELGEIRPVNNPPKRQSMTAVKVIKKYRDIALNKVMKVGEVCFMDDDRAAMLSDKGFIMICDK